MGVGLWFLMLLVLKETNEMLGVRDSGDLEFLVLVLLVQGDGAVLEQFAKKGLGMGHGFHIGKLEAFFDHQKQPFPVDEIPFMGEKGFSVPCDHEVKGDPDLQEDEEDKGQRVVGDHVPGHPVVEGFHGIADKGNSKKRDIEQHGNDGQFHDEQDRRLPCRDGRKAGLGFHGKGSKR